MTPEVRAFEYALGLFAVLIGLAVADIATSAHRLLRAGATVTWDPLAAGSALYALCLAVAMWFDIWGVRNFAATRHFPFYVGLVGELFILFLIAAASLPDELHGRVDLRHHYESGRRYFWSLVAIFQLMYVLFGLYFVGGMLGRLPPAHAVALLGQMVAPLLIAVVLLSLSARAVHYVGVALLLALVAVHYGPLQIN